MLAFFQLTFDCNSLCPACSNEFDRSTHCSEVLHCSQWDTILSKVQPYVSQIRVTGGEPTLHPDFEAVLHSIDRSGIEFVLFSNARWREPQRVIKFLKSLSSNFLGILVSLHGTSTDTHEQFTKTLGSFDETCRNIALATTAGLSVFSNTVITPHNYDKLLQIREFGKTLGCNLMVVGRHVGRAGAEVKANPRQLKEAIGTIQTLKAHNSDILCSGCVPHCFASSDFVGCGAGFSFFTVDPWGNAHPCNHINRRCGNLLTQSVEDILNSHQMKQWREQVPVICRDCVAFEECGGGCKAEAVAHDSLQDPLMKRK